MNALYGLLALAGAALIAGVIFYNRLIRRRVMTNEGWSGIDVQLKRRHDLIPNLVETVKSYRIYEADLLNELTALRAEGERATSPAALGPVEGRLSCALTGLFAVAEAYPDLKANTVFLDLQQRLTDLEDQIQYARRYYNGTVRNLNIAVESFPSVIVARLFGFIKAEYFELDDVAERAAPEVKV